MNSRFSRAFPSLHAAHSRRDFVGRFSMGAVGTALGLGNGQWRDLTPMRIARIEVFPMTYPMVGRFKFFEGPEGSPTGRSTVMVKLTTDDGTVGWGQSVPIPKWSYETRETVTSTLRNYLAPELIGHNVFDIAGAHALMDRSIAPSFSMGQPMAKAGIDLALHDAVGKLMGESLATLWGRKEGGSLTMSWTANPVSLDDLDPLLDDGIARGYKHVNIKVGPDPAFDVQLASRVKARLPDGFLWADANGGYDTATALRAAPLLADAGVDILEQPLPSNRLAGYRELRQQGALPILMDEGLTSAATMMEMIRLDLMDGIAMKPARCGGLVPAKRQYEMAQDAGLMIVGSGLTDPDVSLAATLVLYGAFDYRLPAALNGPQFMDVSVLKSPLEPMRDGTMAVPTGPGLGVEVDEAKMRALMVEE
jgi:L-alanine-DL-glutamate epimerase-like enolase superfamily enzyme